MPHLKVDRYVSRVAWRATPQNCPVSTGQIWPSRLGVAIHWEGPELDLDEPEDHSRCDDAVRGIQRYHLKTQKWLDIAYSYLVCPHGYVYEGRGLGRRTAANGTTKANDGLYAVCALVGKGDTITPALKTGLRNCVEALCEAGARRRVTGHRAHFPTECPGQELTDWIKDGLPVKGLPKFSATKPKPPVKAPAKPVTPKPAGHPKSKTPAKTPVKKPAAK